MPIEIGPDGTPIVTNPDTPASPSTGGFEVSETNKPPDAIQPPKVENKPTGMANRIEEAKQFNSNLATRDKVRELTNQTPQNQTINKDAELMFILKRYGMDSQQQAKAFAEIKALFRG